MAAPDSNWDATSHVGAYGFRMVGLGSEVLGLLPAPEAWPSLEIREIHEEPAWEQSTITEDRAELVLIDDVFARLDREPPLIEFSSVAGIDTNTLIHPFLAAPVSIHSRWQGWENLHGGAFSHRGQAWAVLADREGGKSTLLAALCSRGIPVLTDDLLVIEDRTLFAGPRMIDLREGSGIPQVSPAVKVGSGRGRDRWRLELGEVAPETRLGGFLFLEWASGVRADPVTGVDLLKRLFANRALLMTPGDPSALMRLAALPAWEVRRPRRVDALGDTVEVILRAISSVT